MILSIQWNVFPTLEHGWTRNPDALPEAGLEHGLLSVEVAADAEVVEAGQAGVPEHLKDEQERLGHVDLVKARSKLILGDSELLFANSGGGCSN